MKPIHVASINSIPVRFFADPTSGVDEPPWVVFEDLHQAMGQPADDLARCMEAFEILPAGEAWATMSTDAGPKMIVSSLLAVSFTVGLGAEGRASPKLVHAYGEASGDAIDALLKDLPSDERAKRKQEWLSEVFDSLGGAGHGGAPS